MHHYLQQIRNSISRKNLTKAAKYENLMTKVFGPLFPQAMRYHKEDSDISMEQYVRSKPVSRTETRRFFHIQTLGELSPTEEKIVQRVVEYVETFFGIPAQIIEPIQEEVLPLGIMQELGNTYQLDADFVLSNLIADFVPRSSLGLIMITKYALYSKELAGSLLGCALINKRAAIWTLGKFDFECNEPQRAEEIASFLKLTIHELGHAIGLPHCEEYACIMGMVEHRYLATYPAAFCPGCFAKLCWNLKMEEGDWLQRQKRYWESYGYEAMADFYERMIERYEESATVSV